MQTLFCITNICCALIKKCVGIYNTKTTIIQVCNQISKINIFYVKVLQWFTFDITDDPQTNKELYAFFSSFTNKVPYKDCDINYKSLENLIIDVKKDGHEIDIDFKPINSGTVALVFKGYLDSRPIVIKVLRNKIHESIHNVYNQLLVLKNMIKWIKNIFNLSSINDDMFSFLLNYCKNDLSLQTDFLKEATHIEKFKTVYDSCKFIEIPQVYIKYTLTNSDIIVMDYLEGCSLEENTIKENEIYLDIIHKFIISCYFIHNIYHGDLHLGNIIFMKNKKKDKDKENAHYDYEYKLGIIDFGLMGELNHVLEQNLVYDLLLSYSSNDGNEIMQIILRYLETINNKKNDTINDSTKDPEIIKLMKLFSNTESGHPISVYEIQTFLRTCEKYKLDIPNDVSMFLLASAAQSGSINKINELAGNVNLRVIIKNITDNFI